MTVVEQTHLPKLRGLFENRHSMARPCNRGRGGQATEPGANNANMKL